MFMEENARTDGKVLTNASRTWLAHKMEYRYFLLQPSLPPREVMVVRGASGALTLARPVYLLRFFPFFRPPPFQ